MLKPEIIVFAGQNGSGKSTVISMAKIILPIYSKALKLLPELIEVCDICHIYDNSI